MHILFKCTNHSNLPFYKHSLVVIYWSLYLSSTADMLSSDLTFYIHQTIYASVPPNLITSSSLTGQISLPRIILHKTTGHNLPSVPKIKPLVRKSSKSLKVTYPLFFFAETLLTEPLPAPFLSQRSLDTTLLCLFPDLDKNGN